MTAADPAPTLKTDIAVIGAGVAGTYCADRLARETGRKVTVFEARDRVGGRLWTYDWAEAGVKVELGGEAFSPAHAMVAGLTRELGLPITPHAPFNTMHRYFLRDGLLTPPELTSRAAYPATGRPADAVRARYFLPDAYFAPPGATAGGAATDSVPSPPEALANALLGRYSPEVPAAFQALCNGYMERLAEVAGLDGAGHQSAPLTAAQVQEFVTPALYRLMGQTIKAIEQSRFQTSLALGNGPAEAPCHSFDLWSEVVAALGQEAYELFRAAGYDNTSAFCFNLVEMTENLLLGALLGMAAPNFWTIDGGFERLPAALMNRAGQAGAQLQLGLTLQTIRRRGDGDILLGFTGRDGAPVTCQAAQVVVTAPLSLFDGDIMLDGFDPALTKAFHHRRRGVATVAAQKLYLVYPRPWWEQMTDIAPGADRQAGYATTDLPNRAVYYKGTTGDGRALMTGALTDGMSSDFWTGFLSPTAAIFPGSAPDLRRLVGAPANMVGACHRLLAQMHGGALAGDMPEPELAIYHEWRTHGGGWSAWRSGRAIHTEAARLRLPFRADGIDQGLFFCGDSVAERHGWVENVLESAEAMLREGFGLGPAPCVPGGEVF